MLSKLFRSAQKCNLFFCTFKWEFHRFWLHEWTWETPSLSKVPALQKSSKITQDKSFCLGTRLTWKCNVFSVDVGFRFICTSMSANTGAYNTCHKLLKQTPFHLSFLEKFWHLLLAPLFSLKTLKCAPLLPQCWATRILELSDDCNTQINIGEGETNTNVSRFEASIVAPQGN